MGKNLSMFIFSLLFVFACVGDKTSFVSKFTENDINSQIPVYLEDQSNDQKMLVPFSEDDLSHTLYVLSDGEVVDLEIVRDELKPYETLYNEYREEYEDTLPFPTSVEDTLKLYEAVRNISVEEYQLILEEGLKRKMA